MRWPVRAFSVAVGVACAAAACGGSEGGSEAGDDAGAGTVAEVLAAVEGLDAEARAAKLVELALAEGGVLTWYTSSNADEGVARRHGLGMPAEAELDLIPPVPLAAVVGFGGAGSHPARY